ncbi:unnamed protein product [Rotaria sp. Silwood2]|nr:unnamed protein product [Rotaria sp. Silwood2]CAF2642009.1 unnamed protein product [Rotaria sp. Silwood2]CAF2916611.1 unnamed protein product [Rotaria sp. Silwood2]CAF3050975.1 unnamed protein product [Rotaria sp. Silwood2]CAF3955763.1 unnamed protein product [Rotaria sp. Silwood2]
MTNTDSSSPPQFDVATAALEHLELLNNSNLNPLEIAAQFRTLLRSKKARGSDANNKNENSPTSNSNMDYTYMDYLAADAAHRRRARSRGHTDRRSKSLGRIKYDLDDDDDNNNTNNQSTFSHYNQDQSSLNYEHEQSNLRNTIDDTNIYYTTSARHGGLIATTNNTTRNYLPESHSCFGLSKWHDEGDSSTEDVYADSAVGSDYSEPQPHLAFPSSKAVSCDSAISGVSSHRQYSSSSSEQNPITPTSLPSILISPSKQHFVNLSQIDETSEQATSIERSISRPMNNNNNYYPTINWKQLREKKHENSLDKAKTFVSTTLPRRPLLYQSAKTTNLNTSSPISLLTYHKNQPNFQKRIEQFHATSTSRPSRQRAVTTDLSQALQSSTMTTSSLTTVSAISARTPSEAESFTYPNVSELRKNFEQHTIKKIAKPIEITSTNSLSPTLESPLSYAPSIISTSGSRSSSSSSSSSSSASICKSRCSSSSSRSSNEIRTPSISPTNSRRPSYTISRLNAASMNNEDILFPIADCNLVIKHKATGGPKKPVHYNRRPSSPHPHPHLDISNNLSNSMYSISSGYTEEAHLSGVCNENELMGGSTDDAVYV